MITKSFDGAAHHPAENDPRHDDGFCPACSCWGCSPACVLAPYPPEVEDALIAAMLASFDGDMDADTFIGDALWLDVEDVAGREGAAATG